MSKQKLPKPWTTVTTLSKTLALILFIALPFLGFYLGGRYAGSIPSIESAFTWKNYQDPNGYFSFQYPPNWRIDFQGKDQTWPANQGIIKDKKDINLTSPEGKIEIVWVDGYGGACMNWIKVKVKNALLTGCHIPSGISEQWIIDKKLDSSTGLGVYIFSTADQPLSKNSKLILKILSTFDFKAK